MSKSLALLFLFVLSATLPGRAQNSAIVRQDNPPATQVKKAKRDRSRTTWLTTLYLRPVEQSLNRGDHGPLIPAQMLEGHPTLCVETPSGPKTVSQLKKGDILYRYEHATQRLSVWEVRIVQRKAKRADLLYSAAKDGGFYPLERMVAVDHR